MERKEFSEKIRSDQSERLVEVPDAAQPEADAVQPAVPVVEPPQRLNPKPIKTQRQQKEGEQSQAQSSQQLNKPVARASDLPPSQINSTAKAPVLEPATFWRRLLAAGVDTSIVACLTALLTFVMVLIAGLFFNQHGGILEPTHDLLKFPLLNASTPQELFQSAALLGACGIPAAIASSISPLICFLAPFFVPISTYMGIDPTWPRFLLAWYGIVPGVIGLLYHSFSDSSSGRGTTGKKLLGIAVSDTAGRQVSFNKAFARNALKSLSLFTGFGLFFSSKEGHKKQTLHDWLTHCLVVARSSIISSSIVDPSIPPGMTTKALKVRRMPLPALIFCGMSILILANFGLGLPLEELRAELFCATMEKLTGAQSQLSLMAMNDLASVYNTHGKHDQAVNVLRKSIVLAQGKYGDGDARTIALEKTLAGWHMQMLAYEQAEPIYNKICTQLEKDPGANAKEVADNLMQYGITLREVKKPVQALNVFNRSLEKNAAVYGKASRNYADNLYWLACVNCEIKQFAEASAAAQKAKDIFDTLLGPNSLEGAYARMWLGRAYVGLSDYTKGEAYLLQANEAIKRGPKQSRRRLLVRQFLANCYRDRGAYDKAERMYEDVLTERQTHPGPNKEELYNDYIQFLLTTGRFAEARDKEEQLAAEVANDALTKVGSKKADYFAASARLGNVYERHTKYREAEGVYQSLIRFGDENFGPEDRRVIEIRQKLAGIYFTEERWSLAEPLYKQVITYLHILPGHGQAELCEAEYKLGVCFEEQGKLTEAGNMLKASLTLNEKTYGRLSANVGLSHYRLGTLMCRQGNFRDAERSLLEALHIFESVVGPEDRYVGDTYIWLGQCYGGLGSYARQQSMLERGLSILKHEDPSYKNLLVGKYFLANCLRDQGQSRQAQILYESIMSELARNPGPIMESVQNDYVKLMRPSLGLPSTSARAQ